MAQEQPMLFIQAVFLIKQFVWEKALLSEWA